MTQPRISVIMSVYNTEPEYLQEAVSSILNQTFRDFEFLIVDDGSNVETKKNLAVFTDPRIRILVNDMNLGLTKSLNRALKECRGDYIARMDSDDFSFPQRFASQLEYMKSHPEYSVIGSRFTITDKKGTYPVHWTDDPEVKRVHFLFYNDGICHPTAFFQRSFLLGHGITYREEVRKAQDYAMWLSIIDSGGRLGLCPEVLLIYRVHPGQITSNISDQMQCEQMTIRLQLDRFSKDFSEEDRQLFYHFYRGEITENEEQLLLFLKQLIIINQEKHIYNDNLLLSEIKKIWRLAALKQIKKCHRFVLLKMQNKLNILSISDR